MTTQLWSILLVLFASLLASISPVLLKKASGKRLFNLKSLATNYFLFGAVILYGLGIIIFITALRGGELSVLYPISSLGYVWASLSSVKFLGEKMNRYKWIGLALIIIGASFVGIGSRG